MSLVSKRNYTQGPAPSGENRLDAIEDDPIIYRLHSYDVKVASIMFYMSKRASNGAAVTVMISATVPRPTPHVSAASEGIAIAAEAGHAARPTGTCVRDDCVRSDTAREDQGQGEGPLAS